MCNNLLASLIKLLKIFATPAFISHIRFYLFSWKIPSNNLSCKKMIIQNCESDAHSKIEFQLQQKMLAKMDSENEEKPSFNDYLSKYIPIEILQETEPVETNTNIAWEHYCTCRNMRQKKNVYKGAVFLERKYLRSMQI